MAVCDNETCFLRSIDLLHNVSKVDEDEAEDCEDLDR